MRKQLIQKLLKYATENKTVDDTAMDKFIRDMLDEFPTSTKLVYYAKCRNLLNKEGHTQWRLEVPKEWFKERNDRDAEARKTQVETPIVKEDVLNFMHDPMNRINNYLRAIKLLIVCGRRLCELFHTDFELRNEDTELWYIPYKKRSKEFVEIKELTFDYSPKQFYSELMKMRSLIHITFSSFRFNVSVCMNSILNTKKLHQCRSIYILLLRDKYEVKQNQLIYYVCDWLCHDNIVSSQRYIQCKWS